MRAPLAVALATAVLGAGAPALAQAPAPALPAAPVQGPAAALTLAEVLARAARAAGADRRPETEREAWTAHASGLDGVLTVVRRGADAADVLELGPFRTAHGIARGERWHQNENGQTVGDAADPEDRVASRTLERSHAPLDAWIVATTAASGRTTRTWYDARTFLEVRTEKAVAGRTVTTAYDDFRTDARGRTRPWHYAGGDDRGANDFDYRLARDEPGAAVPDAEVAVPRDRRALVELPPGTEPVRLPARFVDGAVVVRLTIGGRGLDFLLDTGAAALTIDADVARSLGFAGVGRSVQTAAGRFATSRIIVPEAAAGGAVMRDVVMRTAPVDRRLPGDVRVVGLLGFDFLAATVLRVDFAAQTVEALRPGGAAPAGTPVDVRLGRQTPVARAAVGEAAGDAFVLDTGAAAGYLLFARFARAHADALGPASDRERLVDGVGGSVPLRDLGRRRVTLAGVPVDDVPGDVAAADGAFGADGFDGLIGFEVLHRFLVTLDYGAGRIYLAPEPAAVARTPAAARVPSAGGGGLDATARAARVQASSPAPRAAFPAPRAASAAPAAAGERRTSGARPGR